MVNALMIHPRDNVVVALHDLPTGTRIAWDGGAEDMEIIAKEEIPFGHKVAIAHIPTGESVIKYGASIGVSTADIAPGQHVHRHNLRSVRGAAT